MTIEEAREILEDECDGISDEQLKAEIESAKFIKDIFFNFLKKGKKTKSKDGKKKC